MIKIRDILLIGASAFASMAWSDIALAQSASGDPNAAGATPSNGSNDIVVTAQKVGQRLQDVPVAVSVVNTPALAESNQVLIQDFYTKIPSLNIAPGSQSALILSIRGITTGYGNPTVGITIDDVPFGSSTAFGGGLVVPDLDPGDLERIEVLRGPQGTLYGASSMGGLLKFVTKDPTTDRFSGQIQAGLSSVDHGSDLGYNVRGAVNVPLGETLALSVSGFDRRDPGYIDNPIRHVDDVNKADAYGGRLSALWRPSSDFSLKLGALFQRIKADGASEVDVLPGLGDLQQNYLPGLGGYDRRVQAYSAISNADLGFAKLTTVTGYNVNKYSDTLDYSYALGDFTNSVFPGDFAAPLLNAETARKFSQEVRLTIPIGTSIEWLVGGFFTNEHSSFHQDVAAADTQTVHIDGFTLSTLQDLRYKEYAAFSNVTFHLGDRFDIQVGGRKTYIRQTFSQVQSGVLTGSATPIVTPQTKADSSPFTYSVSATYRLSHDLMFYARIATGYRAGGTNGALGAPLQYNPDKTTNYEIGTKGSLFDNRLSFDLSAYRIDWKAIQLLQAIGFQNYTTNGSNARSQGVEASLEARPGGGLVIAGWVAAGHAKLTQNFAPSSASVGLAGDSLPYSSRFSANVSVDEEANLSASVVGFAGAALSYVGDRKGVFTSTADRQDYPSYTKIDLKVGFKYQDWTATAFVNNVADTRGAISGGLGSFPDFAFHYIQPRTIGFSILRKF